MVLPRRATLHLFAAGLLMACSAGTGSTADAGPSTDAPLAPDARSAGPPWTLEGGTFLAAPSRSELSQVLPYGDGWAVQIAAVTSVGGGGIENRTLRNGAWRTLGRNPEGGTLAALGDALYVARTEGLTRFSLARYEGDPATLITVGTSAVGPTVRLLRAFGYGGSVYVLALYYDAGFELWRWGGSSFVSVARAADFDLPTTFARSRVTAADDGVLVELSLAGDVADAPSAALWFDGATLRLLDRSRNADLRRQIPRYCRVRGVTYRLRDEEDHSVLERVEAGGRTRVMASAERFYWLAPACDATRLAFIEYEREAPLPGPRRLLSFDGTALVQHPFQHDGSTSEPLLAGFPTQVNLVYFGERAGRLHLWVDTVVGTGPAGDALRSFYLTRSL